MLPYRLEEGQELGVPVIVAEDVWEATHEAACDLYDDPSTRMVTVGIAGEHGLILCAAGSGCLKHPVFLTCCTGPRPQGIAGEHGGQAFGSCCGCLEHLGPHGVLS